MTVAEQPRSIILTQTGVALLGRKCLSVSDINLTSGDMEHAERRSLIRIRTAGRSRSLGGRTQSRNTGWTEPTGNRPVVHWLVVAVRLRPCGSTVSDASSACDDRFRRSWRGRDDRRPAIARKTRDIGYRVTFTTATLICRWIALMGDAAMPALIHLHEANALAMVYPHCAVVPMHFKAVGPHQEPDRIAAEQQIGNKVRSAMIQKAPSDHVRGASHRWPRSEKFAIELPRMRTQQVRQ